MKLGIFKEELENPTIYFKLTDTRDGDIVMYAVDKNGTKLAKLLVISPAGILELCGDIPTSLGFKLDHLNRIQLDREPQKMGKIIPS